MKRELTIIVELEESEELRKDIEDLRVKHNLSGLTTEFILEAAEQGAIVESLRSGRAHVSDTTNRKR